MSPKSRKVDTENILSPASKDQRNMSPQKELNLAHIDDSELDNEAVVRSSLSPMRGSRVNDRRA